MKKWFLASIALILLLLFVYFLVPGDIQIHPRLLVAANTKAFARVISDDQKRTDWWPEKKINRNQSYSVFEFNGNTYSFTKKNLSSLVVTVNKGKDSVLTELVFIPLHEDTVELTWNGFKKTSLNPIRRIHDFLWMKSVNSDLRFLLKKIQAHYSNEDDLYGFHIQKSLVAGSDLISTFATSKIYPTTEFIYNQVDRLKNYIQKNGAEELDYPMLNIHKNMDSVYVARVAIMVDQKLKDSGDIQYRWMLKGGNILVTEVKGGPHQIEKAFIEMGNYVDDHRHIAPAIPFQSLITDRRQELDTNKWVTKLYWPVI